MARGRLEFGSLTLHSDDPDQPYEVLADNASFGNPQPVDVAITSLLVDGTLIDSQSDDNREMFFRVICKGADSQEVSKNAALLHAETRKRSTLTWFPADGYAEPSVFDVETSALGHAFNDIGEAVRNKYEFGLKVTAQPFARPRTPTPINAAPVAAVATIYDECQVTSGWSSLTAVGSSPAPATFLVDSAAGNFISGTGAIKVTPTTTAGYGGGLSTISMRFKKSGLSMNATSGGYVVAWLRFEWPGQYTQVYETRITTSGGGTQTVTGLAVEAAANGFVKYAWPVPNPSTVTAIELDVWQGRPGYPGAVGSPVVWVDAIGIAATAASPQTQISFEVGGSARTEASFAISSIVGLGDTLLYTAPDRGDGFRPDLRRWQTTGTNTPDAAAVNGTYVSGSTPATFMAPAVIYRPGAHAVLARIRVSSGTSSSLTLDAVTILGGTPFGPTQTIIAPTFSVASNSDYYVVRIGVLDLPPNRIDPASGAQVRFTTSGGTSLCIDEIMAFPLEDAALTWISCGIGAPSASVVSRVWLDAPTAALRWGQLVVGNDAGRADARAIIPKARGRHLLYPGRMFAYLLSSAAAPALTGEFFERYHTHVARRAV